MIFKEMNPIVSSLIAIAALMLVFPGATAFSGINGSSTNLSEAKENDTIKTLRPTTTTIWTENGQKISASIDALGGTKEIPQNNVPMDGQTTTGETEQSNHPVEIQGEARSDGNKATVVADARNYALEEPAVSDQKFDSATFWSTDQSVAYRLSRMEDTLLKQVTMFQEVQQRIFTVLVIVCITICFVIMHCLCSSCCCAPLMAAINKF